MSLVSDKEMAIARVYAQALLTLAKEQGLAAQVREELAELSRRAQADPVVGKFLSDPTILGESREAALAKILRGQFSDLAVDTVLIMARKGRVTIISHLAEAYRQALAEDEGEVDVGVTTAVPLTDPQREKVRAWAAAFTGKKPVLVESVRADILGGLILQIDDEKFDRSVGRGLRRIKDRLFERASHEIHSGRAVLEPTGR
jgi:F-type H+-transporting ATPase subunit delta